MRASQNFSSPPSIPIWRWLWRLSCLLCTSCTGKTEQHQDFWCFQREEYSIMSEAEEYEVETIVSKRLRKGKLVIWGVTPAISWIYLQARLSTLWSGRGGRTQMTTPGSQLATLSAMWVASSFVSCRCMCFTIFCKHRSWLRSTRRSMGVMTRRQEEANAREVLMVENQSPSLQRNRTLGNGEF